MLRRVNRQGDGCDHEQDGRPSSSFRKGAGGSAGAECGLATLASEGGRDITALAALQQHDHNDEETDQKVNSGDKINHGFSFPEFDRRTSG